MITTLFSVLTAIYVFSAIICLSYFRVQKRYDRSWTWRKGCEKLCISLCPVLNTIVASALFVVVHVDFVTKENFLDGLLALKGERPAGEMALCPYYPSEAPIIRWVTRKVLRMYYSIFFFRIRATSKTEKIKIIK